MNENIEYLKQAVQFALDGDWDAAHKIAQDYADESANWIHAVLHKIEGDEWNSMYWYKKTDGKHYADATTELEAIARLLV